MAACYHENIKIASDCRGTHNSPGWNMYQNNLVQMEYVRVSCVKSVKKREMDTFLIGEIRVSFISDFIWNDIICVCVVPEEQQCGFRW